MRRFTMLLLCAALCAAPLGCANIQNDGTRTKTEGTLVGTGAGALLGAGIGALFGGGKGAAIGAGAGAVLGAGAGYLVGSNIAEKKAMYASEEDYLDACIADSKQINEQTHAYNNQLKQEVASLDKESKKLAAAYKRQQTDRKTMVAERDRINAKQKEVKTNIAALEKDVQAKKTAVADDRQAGEVAKAKQLDAEIAKTRNEIARMKEYNSKLASISVRCGV